MEETNYYKAKEGYTFKRKVDEELKKEEKEAKYNFSHIFIESAVRNGCLFSF